MGPLSPSSIRPLFKAVWCHLSASSFCSLLVIINKTTWFSRFWLYFDLYARFIVILVRGIYKILRAIVLLFRSNFFQSFIPAGKSTPSQLYWLIKCLSDILFGWFSMFWWFNATAVEYWKHLLSLFFGFIVAPLFRRFYVRFYSFQACFMTMIRQ